MRPFVVSIKWPVGKLESGNQLLAAEIALDLLTAGDFASLVNFTC